MAFEGNQRPLSGVEVRAPERPFLERPTRRAKVDPDSGTAHRAFEPGVLGVARDRSRLLRISAADRERGEKPRQQRRLRPATHAGSHRWVSRTLKVLRKKPTKRLLVS